jgi:hypothetical protein
MGLHTSLIDLCSTPTRFFIHVRLFRCAVWIRKRKGDERPASRVDGHPPAPALLVAPLCLLYDLLHCGRSPYATPPASPCRPAASPLWPASPDVPWCAHVWQPLPQPLASHWGRCARRSIGPWCGTPPASTPATAAAPRCRWRRRPHQDTMQVASVHFKCFNFRGTLQVFHKDVAK